MFTDMTFAQFERGWDTAHDSFRFENCRFLNGFIIRNSAGRPFRFASEAQDLWHQVE